MDSKKKILWLVVILILALVALGGFFCFRNWWQIKQVKIERGLANEKFPWRDYSQEELEKMYPQTKYVDVLTRITPEQTYANFREALRTNNLEMALAQLSEESENYEENRLNLEKVYEEGKFIDRFRIYSEQIVKENLYESVGQYYFLQIDDGHNLRQYINFIKDKNGDWKMDSL